jgi:hypothetical protein
VDGIFLQSQNLFMILFFTLSSQNEWSFANIYFPLLVIFYWPLNGGHNYTNREQSTHHIMQRTRSSRFLWLRKADWMMNEWMGGNGFASFFAK